jgi:Ca2+-transporting ATPase
MEQDLIFIGLCGMIDPVRPEVVGAIKACATAGVRPIMITGDHKDTAVAIAKELGIIEDASQAITGAELNELSDEELEKVIDVYSVYARVQPEHKVRIVKAWKKLGKITAMTGDGVNDAPSIKSADIGIGMGITGTDVTKNVADMILGDDNFATIVYAVEEGRKIYSNIRKAIQFLLSSNLSEVITIFTATCLGFTILEAPHLLWINLITDTFPALALGMEPGEDDIMKQPPRSSKAGIFSGGVGTDLIYQGLMVSILTLSAYFVGASIEFGGEWSLGMQSNHGITMAFLTMSMAEIFHSLNMRSQRGSIFSLKKHNLWLYGAMIAAVILTALVIEVPFLANLFGFTKIDLREYGIAMVLAVLVIPVTEIIKLIQRTVAKRRK